MDRSYMNKTSIEWVKNPDGSQGYTWNPITGCLNHINGLCNGGGFPCYAYKLANTRLKQRYYANKSLPDDALLGRIYDDPFYPRFWEERLYHPWGGKRRGIFVCDISDLFGVGIPEEWTRTILDLCRKHEQNRYYLLTKQPQNLIKFSPFPENAWVGITATNAYTWTMAPEYLSHIEASVKFISLEPMLEQLSPDVIAHDYRHWADWLIIGACTGSSWEMVKLGERYNRDLTEPSAMTRLGTKWTLQPRIEWVQEKVEAAEKAGVKVFLKENLRPLLTRTPLAPFIEYPWAYRGGRLRQEVPL